MIFGRIIYYIGVPPPEKQRSALKPALHVSASYKVGFTQSASRACVKAGGKPSVNKEITIDTRKMITRITNLDDFEEQK